MAESEAPAVADEDIAEMKAILGDELAEDEIRRLLRSSKLKFFSSSQRKDECWQRPAWQGLDGSWRP
eukprot:1768605-Rhodomonas_salina.3